MWRSTGGHICVSCLHASCVAVLGDLGDSFKHVAHISYSVCEAKSFFGVCMCVFGANECISSCQVFLYFSLFYFCLTDTISLSFSHSVAPFSLCLAKPSEFINGSNPELRTKVSLYQQTN